MERGGRNLSARSKPLPVLRRNRIVAPVPSDTPTTVPSSGRSLPANARPRVVADHGNLDEGRCHHSRERRGLRLERQQESGNGIRGTEISDAEIIRVTERPRAALAGPALESEVRQVEPFDLRLERCLLVRRDDVWGEVEA